MEGGRKEIENIRRTRSKYIVSLVSVQRILTPDKMKQKNDARKQERQVFFISRGKMSKQGA